MAVPAPIAVLLAAAMMAGLVAAQQPTCTSKLVSCAPYLNVSSAAPPESCCGPLKDAVKNELPCLCSLLGNKVLLLTFNVDVDQALQLPKRCGISQDQSICKTAAAGAASPPATDSAASVSPATKSASTSNNKNSNAAQGIGTIGFSGLVGLFLFWWSMVA